MSKIWIFYTVCWTINIATIGYAFGIQSMEDDAIEVGAAYYHPKTRVFTWQVEE